MRLSRLLWGLALVSLASFCIAPRLWLSVILPTPGSKDEMWHSVESGMRQTEAEHMLGEPDEVRSVPCADGICSLKVYFDGPTFRAVQEGEPRAGEVGRALYVRYKDGRVLDGYLVDKGDKTIYIE